MIKSLLTFDVHAGNIVLSVLWDWWWVLGCDMTQSKLSDNNAAYRKRWKGGRGRERERGAVGLTFALINTCIVSRHTLRQDFCVGRNTTCAVVENDLPNGFDEDEA